MPAVVWLSLLCCDGAAAATFTGMVTSNVLA
jgi:hypothetical protein